MNLPLTNIKLSLSLIETIFDGPTEIGRYAYRYINQTQKVYQ